MVTTVTPEQIDTITHRYAEGETAQTISNIVGLSPTTVYKYLRMSGIPTRSRGRKGFPLNHNVFQDISKESAQYWAGFIAADGHINTKRRGNPSLDINISAVDMSHLEKFKVFIGTTQHKITAYTRTTNKSSIDVCSISIVSTEITQRLGDLGVKGPQIDDTLLGSRHFWRGVVDGDGYISKIKKYPVLTLAGRPHIIEPYKVFLEEKLGIGLSIDTSDSTALRLTSAGGTTRKIVDYLYTDSSVYLDRKKLRSDDILKYYIGKEN